MKTFLEKIRVFDCWAKLLSVKDLVGKEAVASGSLPTCTHSIEEVLKPSQNILTHTFLVGYCAKHLIENIINPFLIDKISLDIIPYIVLHDIGKIHSSFLFKNDYWVNKYVISSGVLTKDEVDSYLEQVRQNKDAWHHTIIGANLFYSEIIKSRFKNLVKEDNRKTYLDIINYHHGYKRGEPSLANFRKDFGIDLSSARKEFVDIVEKHFGSLDNHLKEPVSNEHKLLIRGITTVADWLASSLEHIKDSASFSDLEYEAEKALVDNGFIRTDTSLVRGLSFQDIMCPGPKEKFDMNNFQKSVDEIEFSIEDKGAVFIFEARTGYGKTEAVFWLFYKAMLAGLINGCYWGSPTQATSDHLYGRLNSFICRSFNKNIKGSFIRLIHSTSFLSEENERFYDLKENRFYNKNKISLSYPFGLGTVDQMLLSVTDNAKHADMRFFGLANKLIFIDELHSYTVFTNTLLKEAIQRLRKLGCIIVILSATLTKEAKEEILDEKITDEQYPTIIRARL